MTRWTLRASKLIKVTRGAAVAFTEGRRTKFGTVIRVDHDHYLIEDREGIRRRILHERVEALTPDGRIE